jgi:PKD domain
MSPPIRPVPPRFSPSTYAGIGVLGVALLVVGIWYTVLQGVPDAGYLRIVIAIVGGYLAAIGWIRWYQTREEPRRPSRAPTTRRDSVPGFPSLEIYSPGEEDRARPPEGQVASVRRLPRASRAGRWTVVAILAVLAALTLSGLSPTAFVSSGANPAPAPALASSAPSARTVAPTPSGPAAVTPSIMCIAGIYPVYTSVSGLYPPLPLYIDQKPCHVVHDEVHETFSSNTPLSGQRLRVPVYLPNGSQASLYNDFYVGMVVGGNASSVDGQSYAEVIFQPYTTGTTSTWNVTLAVWSLYLNTTCPTGVNMTWEGYYGCIANDLGGGAGQVLETGVPGGQFTNLTLVGNASAPTLPLRLMFNDSTNANYSVHYNFTKAATGTDTFYPYYDSSCPDACLLNWSMPFGLGIGVDLCDSSFPTCFSYNTTSQLSMPPIEVGSPEYWLPTSLGGSYTGDYRFVAPESATGACSGQGAVPACDPAAQAGVYPFFSFNGSALNFGTNWSYTTQDWGGAVFEFNGAGTLTDDTPLFLDQFTNNSRAGYLAPGAVLNVSVRVQDLGTISLVNLSYTLPGGSPINETMVANPGGTASNATYNTTIPSVGADGPITFRVWASNYAGALVALPTIGTPAASVLRGPVPSFQITADTSPTTCGGVSLNGSGYRASGTIFTLLAGTYTAKTNGCYSYLFQGWQASGGVTVTGSGTTVTVSAHGNGTVTADWQYVRPIYTVTLNFDPSSCGSITLSGQTYNAPGTFYVPLFGNGTYTLLQSPCGGDSFAGWNVSSPRALSILGTSLTLLGNGTLTANFVPTSTSAPILFLTNPATCGGVALRGVGYPNGSSISLTAGTYPIGPDSCSGYGWAGNVSTTGGLSVANGQLTVTGGGTVTYDYYQLTLVTILTYPTGCGGILWDGLAVPGGAVLNVTNHTDHSIASDPCAGSYLIGYVVTGNVTLLGSVVEVDGPGSVEAIYRAGTPSFFVGFITSPSGCGNIVFNGTPYDNAEYVDVTPNSVVPIGTVACSDYGFVSWVLSGGIQIAGGRAYVNQSGAIEAIFHPLVSVLVETTPSDCGEVNLSGALYVNGMTALLPDNAVYSISAVPCLHETLSTWVTSSGGIVANGTISLVAAAIVTAVFVPAVYSVGLFVVAGGCGQVTVNNVAYSNNTTLSLLAGTYSLASDLCAGYQLENWSTTGGLSVNASGLIVNGSGAVTEQGVAVPPTLTISAPATASSGSSVLFSVKVAVPVPPYDYNYTWSFGDGGTATTSAGFTSHTYASPGTYLVRVTVIDPLHRTASSSTNVTVLAASNGPTFSVGTTTLLVLVGVIALLAIAIVAALWTRRRASQPAEDAAPPTGDPAPELDWPELEPPNTGGSP